MRVVGSGAAGKNDTKSIYIFRNTPAAQAILIFIPARGIAFQFTVRRAPDDDDDDCDAVTSKDRTSDDDDGGGGHDFGI